MTGGFIGRVKVIDRFGDFFSEIGEVGIAVPETRRCLGAASQLIDNCRGDSWSIRYGRNTLAPEEWLVSWDCFRESLLWRQLLQSACIHLDERRRNWKKMSELRLRWLKAYPFPLV